MPATSVKLDDRKLQRMLKELPDRIERKVIRQATTLATTPILKAAKSLCPKDNGLLKKSLIKKIKTYTKSNTVVGIIGSNRATFAVVDGKRHRPANYIHLVEDGAKPHQITITNKATGQKITLNHPGFSGRHFMKRAYDSSKGQATAIAKTKMAEGTIAEGRKLGI